MTRALVLLVLLWGGSVGAEASTTSTVTLKLAVLFDKTFIARMDQVLADFHSQQGRIRIQQVCLPGFYQDDLVSRHRAGESYDLVLVPDPAIPQFVQEGVLLSLGNDLLSSAARERLLPWTVKACSHENQLYAAPFIWSPYFILCNPVLFEQAKQPLPSTDWSFLDLRQTAEAMTSGTGSEKIHGLSINTVWWSGWYPLLWRTGGHLEAYPDWTDSALNRAALNDVFSLISSLDRRGALESTGDIALFARGETAMITASANEVQFLRERNKPWVIRPLPQPVDGVQPRNGYGVAGLGIHSRSPNAPEAAEFLRHLTTDQAAHALVAAGFLLPCHQQFLKTPGAAQRLLGEEGSAFLHTAPDQQSPRFLDFLWAVDVMRSNLQAMIKHDLEPAAAVRSLLFQLHDELDEGKAERSPGVKLLNVSCEKPDRRKR